MLSASSEFSEDDESLSEELKINKRYTKTVDFETERKPREFVGRRECYSTRIDRLFIFPSPALLHCFITVTAFPL